MSENRLTCHVITSFMGMCKLCIIFIMKVLSTVIFSLCVETKREEMLYSWWFSWWRNWRSMELQCRGETAQLKVQWRAKVLHWAEWFRCILCLLWSVGTFDFFCHVILCLLHQCGLCSCMVSECPSLSCILLKQVNMIVKIFSPSVCKYDSVMRHFWGKVIYLSKIAIFHTPLNSMSPFGRSPPEYCHYTVWCGKTRMVRLCDGEKN